MFSLQDIILAFARHADEKIACGQQAYMKNKFEFFGIKAPERRDIQRPFLQKKNLPQKAEAYTFINQLWEQPQRELQYFAMELLYKYKSQFEKCDLDLFEQLIIQKSWWDTVDFLAANVMGHYLSKFPEEQYKTIEKWLNTDNMWLHRTCLLFQLKYKENMDTGRLQAIINRLLGSNDFFINKAIGWVLREYRKTNPQWVIRFVKENPLSTLSHREALKVINRKWAV